MKIKYLISIAITVLAFSVIACGKDKSAAAGGGKTGSCNKIQKSSVCTEYGEKSFILGEDFIKKACEQIDGKYSSGACPTEKLLGNCKQKDDSVRKYYSTGSMAASEADSKKDCESLYDGTWSK